MISITEDIISYASNVLTIEAANLKSAAERLKSTTESKEGYQQAIYLMFKSLDIGGKIIVTGVGKSGKIAEKIVATMLSVGICATFLHPIEALHGDLGIVQRNDIILAISFSGNTEELLMLLPSLKHRRIPIIGLGGNPKSKLAKECAAWIDGYVQCEAGDSIPAPTCSTTLALALGDALALTLAKLRDFNKGDFALNHPGGSLGRRLLLKVKDILISSSKVACVSRDTPLDVIIMEMTKHPRGSGVIVIEKFDNDSDATTQRRDYQQSHFRDHELFPSPPLSEASSMIEDDDEVYSRVADSNHSLVVVGVITHDDIHRVLKSSSMREDVFKIRAIDIMTSNPIVFDENRLTSEAVSLMKEKNIPLLPIVRYEKYFIGVVTLKDLQELF
ncbi:uncharacterized protein BX663DRAFT_526746 [Cokeromyces recurvatus]|uniref:uncharacterized protein n=1 Tax=Cokeromyces recurvatus TaxID=90255 RepID=UPI00221EBAFF|nr:uncharacterized protein BX663DRAFT_526746 [Cokeromyces recurvatus]KAI7897870.1 hypothetical protein BX663DRAFT_526746 [Cokeromyces recurvatus]